MEYTNMKLPVLLLTVSAAAVAQQTLVDLRTQSKSIDFSAAVSTKPITVGTSLPTNCTTGQMFFRSSAVAGANLFGCTSTNTWTALNAQEPEESVIAPTSGSGSAYAPTTNCPQSLAFLQIYDFVPDVANTVVSPTLNICGLGALPIIHNDSTNLQVGELQPGHAYPLVVNPTVTAFLINWEQLQPDGSQSVQVTRVGNIATIGYRPAVIPDKINTQTLTNFWDFSGAALRPPRSSVANLPAASANTGKLIEVTDGASLCDVTTGGGSTVVTAVSNGTSWIAPNCLPPTLITAVANLPAASANTGKLVEVTDGNSLCDVTTGGGSTTVLAVSNGTSWIAPNCLPSTLITTVANLPVASANTGKLVEVTDGASVCDVTTGGGSTVVVAISNGTSWTAPNCSTPTSIATSTQGWLYPLDVPPSGNSGTQALTANKVVLYAVQPKVNYTIRRFTTLGTVTTSKGLTACMYTSAGSLIANSSSHYVGTGSSATPNMATGGPLSLSAGGFYYLAFTGEDNLTALNLNVWGAASTPQTMLNVNSAAAIAKCTQSSTGTGANLACPSSCTVTADNGAAFMTGWVLLP
jgi:hypothetical protein